MDVALALLTGRLPTPNPPSSSRSGSRSVESEAKECEDIAEIARLVAINSIQHASVEHESGGQLTGNTQRVLLVPAKKDSMNQGPQENSDVEEETVEDNDSDYVEGKSSSPLSIESESSAVPEEVEEDLTESNKNAKAVRSERHALRHTSKRSTVADASV